MSVALSAPALAAEETALLGVTARPQDHGLSPTTDTYVPEIVYFKNAPPPPPSAFKRRIAEKKGLSLTLPEPLTVLGRLYLPAGDPPFAAVVLLHGSVGIGSWNDPWAARLRAWGYVVLDVDSMTPRGLYRHNTGPGLTQNGQPQKNVDSFSRSLDAEGARRYLAARDDVEPRRIAVLGMSQGGETAMFAISHKRPPDRGDTFQAAVALYPICFPYAGFDAPLLVLIGRADEWVSASRCEANLAQVTRPELVTLKVYDEGHHAFDLEAPARSLYGLTLRYDPQATADALPRVKAFLAKHLK